MGYRSNAALVACLALFLGTGCSAIISPDGSALDPMGSDAGADSMVADGAVDSTPGPDGGPVDGGPLDGAPVDGGGDTAVPDGGPVDSGPMGCAADCPLGCPAGSDRCAEIVPSNVDRGLFDADARDLLLSGDAVWFLDTTECTSSMVETRIEDTGEGTDACVLVVGNMGVGPGSTLRVEGSRPLIVVASGNITIGGELDASAVGPESGAGGFRGGVQDRVDGDGLGGGMAGEHIESFDDGGGGGGGLCGFGGGGGDGGAAAGGEGGDRAPTMWRLEPLVGGSGGGRGRGAFLAGGTSNAGLGGAGGGAIQLSAQGSIAVSGAILVGGGGGLGGDVQGGGSVNWGSGGGGGSGGAILLEAPVVDVSGFLNAAGGGGGAVGNNTGRGGGGMDGHDTVDRAAGGIPAMGGSGAGGIGGGARVLDGEAGESIMGGSRNGGGGGGASGCILIRNAAGILPAVASTPSIAPGIQAERAMRR